MKEFLTLFTHTFFVLQKEPFRRVRAEEMEINPKFNNSFEAKVIHWFFLFNHDTILVLSLFRVMKRKKRRKMISTTDRSVRAWASRGTREGVEEAEEDLAVTGTEEDEGVGAEVASEGDAVASAVTVKDPEAAAVASGVTVTGSDGDVVALAVTVMGSEGDAVVLATAGALVVMMMSMVQMVGTTKDSREMERVASGEDEAEALATAGASEIAMVIPMDSITEMSVEEDLEVAEALEIVTVGLEVALVTGTVVDLGDVGIEGEGVEASGGDSIRAQA